MKREALLVEFQRRLKLLHIMNVEKSNFNSYIYTLVLDHFCATIVNLWCKVCKLCSEKRLLTHVWLLC